MLGIDPGDVRTGVAVSDPGCLLASPVSVLTERNYDALVQKTAALAVQYDVGAIVVGYPKNMNGTKGERAQKSERLAADLGRVTGLRILLWDERCTTVSAGVYMNATDTRGSRRKSTIDAAAAAIILQDYLDYRRNTGKE
ncbi:MAG: Holliday junction resolvase RuvX [Clostridia bacterium]|nr:Holliday junction resolvase RuvX [Clostridia bacterium]MDR3644031.1 Holliday junction resolvase RuvX [Clostridia bacterium]